MNWPPGAYGQQVGTSQLPALPQPAKVSWRTPLAANDDVLLFRQARHPTPSATEVAARGVPPSHPHSGFPGRRPIAANLFADYLTGGVPYSFVRLHYSPTDWRCAVLICKASLFAGRLHYAPQTSPLSLAISPSTMRMERSAEEATLGSCVAMIKVVPVCSRSSRIISSTLSLFFWSRLPVGSSIMMIAGFAASARATATRCCSPPESWLGRLRSRCPSPTRFRSSFAHSLALPGCLPTYSGISTFSCAVSVGIRLNA